MGARCWAWLDIMAGIPTVYPQTSERFLPQAANLDLLGGINFRKGCYTGQEIIARLRYLGKLKQRMYRAHADTERVPEPGANLYGASAGAQAVGTVVDAQPSPQGGCDLLAVAYIDSVQGEALRLSEPVGPELALQPLPYALAESA